MVNQLVHQWNQLVRTNWLEPIGSNQFNQLVNQLVKLVNQLPNWLTNLIGSNQFKLVNQLVNQLQSVNKPFFNV